MAAAARRFTQPPIVRSDELTYYGTGPQERERSPLYAPVVRSDFLDHIIAHGSLPESLAGRHGEKAERTPLNLRKLVEGIAGAIDERVKTKEFVCSFKGSERRSAEDYAALGWLYQETLSQPHGGNIRITDLPRSIEPSSVVPNEAERELFMQDLGGEFHHGWSHGDKARQLEAARIKAFNWGRHRRAETIHRHIHPLGSRVSSWMSDFAIGQQAEEILVGLARKHPGPSFRDVLENAFTPQTRDFFYHHERVFLTAAAVGSLIAQEEMNVRLVEGGEQLGRPQDLDNLRVERRLARELPRETNAVVRTADALFRRIDKGIHLKELMDSHNDLLTAMAIGYLLTSKRIEGRPEEEKLMLRPSST
jgi:hypothetical protein